MALTNNVIFTEGEIGNALKSTSSDHVVAAAQNIYDEEFNGGGYQSEINEFLNDKFGDYLPLSGGDITGDLDVTGDISATNVTADTFTGNLSGNASSATNADKLDNHDSSYFATAANLTSTNEEIEDIKASYVKSIQITGSDGIAVTPSTSQNGVVSVSISGTAVKEQIEALGKVVNLSGVYAADTALSSITGKNGDFIIVGQKEYVYWETATTGENNTKWVLLGDTTQLSQDVTNLTNSYNDHKHSVTAEGTVESAFTGDDNTTSKASSNVASVSVISSAGTLPTTANKNVSLSTHKHNVSVIAEGAVESVFTGDDNTTSKASSNIANVSVISSAGTLPTTANKNVSLSTHKHNVSVTAAGTVASTFTGTAASHDHTFTGGNNTTSNNGLTVTYSSGKLSITTSHTHTVTPTGTISSKSITPAGTIASTFTGTSVSGTVGASDANEDVKVVSSVGTLPTYTNVEVPSKDHTHTVTPTGTIVSTFTGTSVSGTVGASDSNEEVKVVSSVGTLPAYTNVEVPSKDHTHTVTPTGTVTSTFTGTPVDTGTKK